MRPFPEVLEVVADSGFESWWTTISGKVVRALEPYRKRAAFITIENCRSSTAIG
jgi:hypothetical protein